MARIVIVEDNDSDRLLLRSILEMAGHETYATEDFDEVLNYCKSGVDVVITDLQMPDIHGLDLIMRLRSLAPEVAVIAVSGTGPDQLEMAEAVGADLSFTKPIEPERLLEAVARVMADRPDVGGGAPDLATEADMEVETSVEEETHDADEKESVESEAPLSLADVMEIEGVTSEAGVRVETSVEEETDDNADDEKAGAADEEELVESEVPLSPEDVKEIERLLNLVDEILLSPAGVKESEAAASEGNLEAETSVDEKSDDEESSESEILLSATDVTEIERLMDLVDEIRLSPAGVRETEVVAAEADLEVETPVDEDSDEADDEELAEEEILPSPADVLKIEVLASDANLRVESSLDEEADDDIDDEDADDEDFFEDEIYDDEHWGEVEVESAGAAVPEPGDSGGVEVGVASAKSGIERAPKRDWRIVVAEDDDEYVFIIERALEKATDGRLEIRRGRNGVEALALLRESVPDLLLLDLKMPGMAGHDVLAEVKSDSALRSVPVVVLSSSDRDDNIARTYELGGNHYITKPSNPVELEAKLGALLRNLEELGRVSRGSEGAATTAVSAVDPDAMLALNAFRFALVVGVLIALYVFGKISGVF